MFQKGDRVRYIGNDASMQGKEYDVQRINRGNIYIHLIARFLGKNPAFVECEMPADDFELVRRGKRYGR